jgi:4-amino-4-deoxy-L-arabinose transferase-like glycosyltransferase
MSLKFENKIQILAYFLLFLVFILAISSSMGDSATSDEPPHIVAGYSYLKFHDMRLNPEHPPLAKSLAVFPLLFLNLNFPKSDFAWQQPDGPYWWHQFNLGGKFLYESQNNADKILFFARFPMILLLIVCGFFIFKFAKEFFGERIAILALFFFSFSPTFLAHGRLVTTDVPAALGVVLATLYFLKALKNPTRKNIILAGITLGISQLLKFSLILILPFFILLTLIWILIFKEWKNPLKVLISSLILWILVVLVVYGFLIYNYPPERQLRDTKITLESFSGGPSSIKEACFLPKSIEKLKRCPAEIVIWASDKPIIRALAHYGLGLLMVFQRASGGHTTYFLGEVSASGWKIYFPFVYLIKEPLAFHIFWILALCYFALKIKEPLFKRTIFRLKNFIKEHFVEFSMVLWLLIYWATSIKSNLNIGVRHLLPVFPFTIILTAKGIVFWLENTKHKKIAFSLFLILILWQAISVLKIYPHFISFANEIVGGPDKVYLYTVNSNLDWGQDLKRLKKWIEENKIEKIYLDYFGGGNPKYYLREKYESWWGQRDSKEIPKGSYLAVSATALQGGRGKPAKGFDQPTGYYLWLEKYKEITKIGYSIFVYYID